MDADDQNLTAGLFPFAICVHLRRSAVDFISNPTITT